MELRRGFKAHARRLALEVRTEEARCGIWVPFDPWALAADYGIQVNCLSEVGADPEATYFLSMVKSSMFSGALLPIGTGSTIVENDSHDLERRRSTVAHEMSHVLLEHKFSTILVRETEACRNSDHNQELEATELAGELLVPADSAKYMARQRLDDDRVAVKFAVSVEMARWRMQMSGARTIARRAAERRGR